MPINSVAGNNNLPLPRPDSQRATQAAPRAEEQPQVDMATQTRAEPSSDTRTQSFEREATAILARQEQRRAAPDSEPTNSRVERADQARDALKARFEESSQPKPQAQFEVRA